MYKWYVCICLLSVLVYINTLLAGFVYDDNRAIIANQDIRMTTPLTHIFLNDFWGTPISSSNSHGSYRPLCVLTFRINYWASGLRPLGYHLVNILLHGIATGLVLHAGSLLLPGKCPLTAAALFAVHPIHTEAVAGIVGRADLLACVFYLLSFVMYVRHAEVRRKVFIKNYENYRSGGKHLRSFKIKWTETTLKDIVNNFIIFYGGNKQLFCQYFYLFLSLCFSICSTLCKETGVTVLGVCAVYEVLQRRRISSPAASLFGIAATALLTLSFRLLLTGIKPPIFSSADNPTAHEHSLITRILTFLFLPLFNFWLILCPNILSFDWSMDAIQRINTLLDSRNFLTLMFYSILYRTIRISYYKLMEKRKENTRKFRCVQCCETWNTLHTTNCCLRNNNNIPSVCSCPVTVTLSLKRHFDVYECIITCLAFLVLPFLPATNLLFYVGFVVAERVLYIPSVGYCFLFALGLNLICKKINKRLSFFILFYLLMTHALRTVQRNKDWKDEESLYRSGIPVNPPKAYGNLGSIFSSLGRLGEAEEALRLALSYRPNMADVHYNLGNLQARLKRYSDSIHSYEKAIKYRPSLAVSYLNLGRLLASLGRYTEAEQVLLKCSRLESSGLKDVKTHLNAQTSALVTLSKLYFERGKTKEAVELYEEAVSKEALQDMLGKKPILQKKSIEHIGLNDKSKDRFTSTVLLYLLPEYLEHGKLIVQNRTTRQEKANLNLQPSPLLTTKDLAIYMHYGKVLIDSGRYNEAVSIYMETLKVGMDQYNVATSAAAALRQAGRYEDAELFYRTALSIRPKDPTSLVNLGAILHLKGNHKEAKSSYKEAKTSYTEAKVYYKRALKLNPRDETALVNLIKLRNCIKHVIVQQK